MAEFEIKVTELDAGGKDYAFPIRSAWLEDELRKLGDAAEGLHAAKTDGSLTFFADKTGEDVIVRGRVAGGVVAECSRCLGPAPILVDVELGMLITARGARGRGPRPDAAEEDMSPDELDQETYSGDTIVLDDAVREHLLLEVPMQPLCRPDCAGIEVPASVKGPADLAAAAARDGKSVMAAAFERAEGAANGSAGSQGSDSHGSNGKKIKRAR